MERAYEEAFTEVEEVLKLMPIDLVSRIPAQLRQTISENKATNYKIVIKTFDRLIKNKENRKIGNMFFDKTRIVYEIKQKYICVKDENCIKNIERFEYDSISGLNKIVNRRLNYEIWR